MTKYEPGQVNKISFSSTILQRDITLYIYLPKSYSDLFKHKVVFCFDGLDFFRYGQIHRLYERERKEGRIERAIFVGFQYEDVASRRVEFHPQGEKSADTVNAMAREILPFIDEQFATFRVGNARLLLGDSLAGSIAFLTTLSYPRIFSQVGMLSPYTDEVVSEHIARCQFMDLLTIWHEIGLEEDRFKLPTNGEEADFLTPNRALKRTLSEEDCTYVYKEFEGGHAWKSWQKRLPAILRYFLSDDIEY